MDYPNGTNVGTMQGHSSKIKGDTKMADGTAGAAALGAVGGSLIGGLLFGDERRGRRDDGGRDGDLRMHHETVNNRFNSQENARNTDFIANTVGGVASRVDTLNRDVIVNRANADQNACQLGAKILENRFISAQESANIQKDILTQGHKSEIIALQGQLREAEKEARDVARHGEIIKGQEAIMCKLANNDKDLEIERLKQQIYLDRRFDQINGNVSCQGNSLRVGQEAIFAGVANGFSQLAPTATPTSFITLANQPRINYSSNNGGC